MSRSQYTLGRVTAQGFSSKSSYVVTADGYIDDRAGRCAYMVGRYGAGVGVEGVAGCPGFSSAVEFHGFTPGVLGEMGTVGVVGVTGISTCESQIKKLQKPSQVERTTLKRHSGCTHSTDERQ